MSKSRVRDEMHCPTNCPEVLAPERARFTYLFSDQNRVYLTSQNRIDCKSPFGWAPNWLLNVFSNDGDEGWCTYNNNQAGEVHKNQAYSISKTDLKRVEYVFNHWTSGVLVVPYKYVAASHDLAKGNFTIGPYFGYTTTWLSTESTFALSAGLANVTVPTTTENGAVALTEKQGLSLAIGLLFKPGGVSTGFLLGVDQLGHNSQYQNNGKLWIGIYVGSGFTSN